MVNDPISDFIIQLQNASRAGKDTISLPFSQMKLAVAQVLSHEGYIGKVDKKSKAGGKLSFALAYKNGKSVVSGVKRISKLSRRVYFGTHDIVPIKRGYGLLILSTPEGILTGKDARTKHVGGEALFEIW